MAVGPTDGRPARSGRGSFGTGLIIGIFVACAAVGVWSHVMAKRDEVRTSGPAIKVPPSSSATDQWADIKIIDPAEGLVRITMDKPPIRALIPTGWKISSASTSSAVDLQSPDHTLYASWSLTHVDRAKEGTLGPLYGDSEASTGALVNGALNSLKEPTDAVLGAIVSRPDTYYTAREWQSSTRQGLVFYHDDRTGGANYVESVYIACATRNQWPTSGGIAVQVASSIRAKARPIANPTEPSLTSIESPGSGSYDPDEALDDTHKSQMGWQTVHSRDGIHFIVNPLTDYDVTGPEGPGYYIKIGNTYQRLTPGRSE